MTTPVSRDQTPRQGRTLREHLTDDDHSTADPRMADTLGSRRSTLRFTAQAQSLAALFREAQELDPERWDGLS